MRINYFVNFYLYSAFVKDEIKLIEPLASFLNLVLGDEAKKIGPKAKKATHVLKSSTWLLNEIHSFLHYHQQNNSDKWNDWLEIDALEELIASANDEFIKAEGFFPEDTKKNLPLLEAAAKLRIVLGELSAQAGQIREDLERIKQEAGDPKDDVSISVKNLESSASESGSKSLEKAASSMSREDMSAPLAELHQKLDAFKALIEQNVLTKASLVANDISGIIENFDPRI